MMYFQDIQNVTPAQTRQGILGTDHGQGGAMDMVHRLLIKDHQVRIIFNNLWHFSILVDPSTEQMDIHLFYLEPSTEKNACTP